MTLLSKITGSNLNPVTITIFGGAYWGGVGSSTVSAIKVGTNTLSGYTVISNAAINGAVIPAGLWPGTYDITVVAAGGTSSTSVSDRYIVTTPAPTVSNLSLATGSNLAPLTITISGTGFFGGMGSNTVTGVNIGTKSLIYNPASDDSTITGVVVPPGVGVGTYDLSVTALGGTSITSSTDKFTVTTPAPTVSSLSLNTSINNLSVTIDISGTGFFGGAGSSTVSAVKIGTLGLSFSAALDDSTISGVIIQSGINAGTYDINVTAAGGTSITTAADQYVVVGKVNAPLINPSSGTYTSLSTITISTGTTGASIRYTKDGTIPSATSTLYSGPFTLTTSSTIIAYAIDGGMADSDTTTSLFTIQAETPTITSNDTAFITSTLVTLNTNTSGATIRYTTDGTDPTLASTIYSSVITLTSSVTLKAAAFKGGVVTSNIGTAVFTGQVATPTIAPNSGIYAGSVVVTITTSTPGAAIRYTTDGSTPNGTSTLYIGTFTQATAATIKAIAMLNGLNDSAIASAVYTFKAIAPVITPVSGTYLASVNLTITTGTSGATIRYTKNGIGLTDYIGPFAQTSSVTIVAYATKGGVLDSDTTTSVFTLNHYPIVTAASQQTASNLVTSTLTVNGNYFFSATGVANVATIALSNGAKTVTVAGYNVPSDTEIDSIIVPSGIKVGTYDVIVTTVIGQSAAGTKFTITTPAPVVSTISPATGSNAVTTTVSITGTGFYGGVESSTVSAITLGTTPITAYNVISDTVISGIVIPAVIVPGTYDLLVTADGGTSATSAVKFGVTNTGLTSEVTNTTATTVTVQCSYGQIDVTVPAGTFTGTVTLTVTPTTSIPRSDRDGVVPCSVGVEITGPPGVLPQEDIVLNLHYSAYEESNFEASGFQIGYYDTVHNRWVMLHSTVYPAERRVEATLRHDLAPGNWSTSLC